MKLICEYYDNIDKDLNNIAEFFGCSYNTIKKYLKDGAKINICTYSPEKSKKLGVKKAVKAMIQDRAKPVLQIDISSGSVINEFESIQSAQRELKISHIWDCLIGKRNTAGGYKWKYKY